MIVDIAGKWQPANSALRSSQAEYAGRAHIVGRGSEIPDESSRKEIGAFLGSLAAAMDEDVGERRCRIADIGLLRERVEDRANEAIDGLRLVLLVGVSLGIKELLSGVDRGMVGFVINAAAVRLQRWVALRMGVPP